MNTVDRCSANNRSEWTNRGGERRRVTHSRDNQREDKSWLGGKGEWGDGGGGGGQYS